MASVLRPSFELCVKIRKSESRDSSGLRTEVLDVHKSARILYQWETLSNTILASMVLECSAPQMACCTAGHPARLLATFSFKIPTVMLWPSSAPPARHDTRSAMSMASFTSSPRLAHARLCTPLSWTVSPWQPCSSDFVRRSVFKIVVKENLLVGREGCISCYFSAVFENVQCVYVN